jgi:hypothetical protein
MHAVETKQAELAKLDEEQSKLHKNIVCSIEEDIKYRKKARHDLIKELDVALRELGERSGDIEANQVANGRRRDTAPGSSV